MKRIRRRKSYNVVGRLYKVKAGIYNSDRYYDEGWGYMDPKYHYWSRRPKKRLLYYQMRMYRTWKHNRKTQWKH